jgi:precorrin-2 dehydrogenase/sirohydrochlorin ferrochelatase
MVLMIPLLFDLSSKKVLIFGGGKVGERKARLFSAYANVVVVSRDFTPELRRMGERGDIELIRMKLSSDDRNITHLISDAFIVIPATDDDSINSAIIELAERYGALINRIDELKGDIIIPSIIKKGNIIVSISTAGKSPAMSKFLRMRLERVITEKDSKMVELQHKLRTILKEEIGEQKRREEILWRVLADERIWDLILEDEDEALKLALKSIE